MKTRIVALALATSILLAACGQRETVVYQQAPAPVAPAPVHYDDHHLNAGDAALIAGSVVAGAMLADYMVNGRPKPGYYVMNGQVYRDTPEVRRAYQKTTVVKKTYIINNNGGNKNVVPAVPTAASAVPGSMAGVAATPATPVNQKSLDQKAIKASADAAAAAEKQKMEAEARAKAEQQQKQSALKAQLQAKQAARASTPAPSKSSGFNSMSNKASSMSNYGGAKKK